MQSAFPGWLRVLWLLLSPLGLVFAARIAWEKTVWTWTRGPQMVGFSLLHVYPAFAITGALCCDLLMLWLIPAAVYLIRRRHHICVLDIGMVVCCLFVTVVMFLPDTFFAQ